MSTSTADVKIHSRKPENTSFKQQRLRAWQPILTPRTVLPTLFLIGILFAPFGGVLLLISNNVSEIVVDYTDCYQAGDNFTPISSGLSKISLPDTGVITNPNMFSYKVREAPLSSPNPNNLNVPRCTLRFNIPESISGPVFLYYQLTNFYQNHRRYVKSVSYRQLGGESLTSSQLATDCDTLVSDSATGKPYYPCGLIANSVFNDTILPFQLMNQDPPTEITFSEPGIAWDSDAQQYKKTKYSYSDVVPPPNWVKRYPSGQYTESNPPPDLSKDEHLQVWMRTAGLPSFRKLYGRLNQGLPKGTYEVDIEWNFNTTLYKGRKFLVISTVSVLGGKNPYLGYAYLILGALCVVLGLIFTVRHLLYPRKLGDSAYLSWNQNQYTSRVAASNAAPPAAPASSDQTLSN